MKAFHSFWSLPNAVRSGGQIAFPDFELLTAILSALYWQKENGPIDMITDSPGKAFFESIGLGALWNRIDPALDHIDPDVDPMLFWAGGKLYALKTMELPCVMLDTDLIIWQNLDGLWDWGKDIVAAHAEGLNPEVYPDPSHFRLKKGYTFPEEWDFTENPSNTAFLYLKNPLFRDQYVDAAIRFFRNVELEGHNPVTAMCFAEQRILPMMARAQHQELGYLLDLYQAVTGHQELATHTWGFKNILRSDPQVHDAFCRKCAARILRDFPDRSGLLTGCDALRPYCDL